MHIEALREYVMQLKGVTEGEPFGPGTLVFKVLTKMFAIMPLDEEEAIIALKMDKELVPEWRERYEDVRPGYHLNKLMWNSVYTNNGTIPKKEIIWMINHSYEEVVKKMTKKDKAILAAL